MLRRFPLVLVAAVLAVAAPAEEPVNITAAPASLTLAPGATGTIRLILEIAEPYHIYSTAAQLDARGLGPSPTAVAARHESVFTLAGALRTSPVKTHFDPNFDMQVETLEGRAWIDVPIKVSAALAPGKYHATLVVSFQACTDESCLPPAVVEVAFALAVSPPAKQ